MMKIFSMILNGLIYPILLNKLSKNGIRKKRLSYKDRMTIQELMRLGNYKGIIKLSHITSNLL